MVKPYQTEPRASSVAGRDFPSKSLESLHRRGAHFVLCRPNKRPLWLNWQRQRPPVDLVSSHDSLIGVVPFSLFTTGADIDGGDPDSLRSTFPPLADVSTRRDGGRHFYYRDNRPRRNRNWQAFGCRGQIRGSNGFLVLWQADAPTRILDGLDRGAGVAFPADMFDAAGIEVEPLTSSTPLTLPAVETSIDLETVWPGARNASLFDVVRHWAYAEPKDMGLLNWKAHVQDFTRAQNDRFPVPLDARELRDVAYSISTWVWAGGGAQHHALSRRSERQRLKGIKSGQARRARNAERDAAILRDIAAGMSKRAVARKYDLAPYAVQHISRRPDGLQLGL